MATISTRFNPFGILTSRAATKASSNQVEEFIAFDDAVVDSKTGEVKRPGIAWHGRIPRHQIESVINETSRFIPDASWMRWIMTVGITVSVMFMVAIPLFALMRSIALPLEITFLVTVVVSPIAWKVSGIVVVRPVWFIRRIYNESLGKWLISGYVHTAGFRGDIAKSLVEHLGAKKAAAEGIDEQSVLVNSDVVLYETLMGRDERESLRVPGGDKFMKTLQMGSLALVALCFFGLLIFYALATMS